MKHNYYSPILTECDTEIGLHPTFSYLSIRVRLFKYAICAPNHFGTIEISFGGDAREKSRQKFGYLLCKGKS